MIRVQGPRETDFYYKETVLDLFTVSYFVEGELVYSFEIKELPNLKQYWEENLAHLYPNVKFI